MRVWYAVACFLLIFMWRGASGISYSFSGIRSGALISPFSTDPRPERAHSFVGSVGTMLFGLIMVARFMLSRSALSKHTPESSFLKKLTLFKRTHAWVPWAHWTLYDPIGPMGPWVAECSSFSPETMGCRPFFFLRYWGARTMFLFVLRPWVCVGFFQRHCAFKCWHD